MRTSLGFNQGSTGSACPACKKPFNNFRSFDRIMDPCAGHTERVSLTNSAKSILNPSSPEFTVNDIFGKNFNAKMSTHNDIE